MSWSWLNNRAITSNLNMVLDVKIYLWQSLLLWSYRSWWLLYFNVRTRTTSGPNNQDKLCFRDFRTQYNCPPLRLGSINKNDFWILELCGFHADSALWVKSYSGFSGFWAFCAERLIKPQILDMSFCCWGLKPPVWLPTSFIPSYYTLCV